MEGVDDSSMKAWVYRRYFGAADGELFPLEQTRLPRPPSPPPPNHVVLRVLATTVNPVDWKIIGGAYRFLPEFIGAPPFSADPGTVPCADGVGLVVESSSSLLKEGDRVCFDNAPRFGALAEFVLCEASHCCLAPRDFAVLDTAASVGLASGTAVYGINYIFQKIDPAPGKRILVLGGAGGVGSAAIQLLSLMGHFVVATCSSRNVDFVKRMGAKETIDYKADPNWWEHYVPQNQPFDAIFQCVGMARDFARASYFHVIKDGGAFVSCDRGGSFVGALWFSLVRKLSNPAHYHWFINSVSTENLAAVVQQMETHRESWVSPLSNTFSFDQAMEAFDMSRQGLASGKIVIRVSDSEW